MWLLDTETLRLESFLRPPERYAILSHRWEERQEVGFGDITSSTEHLQGHVKITSFCELAKRRGFNHVWVDTCCIDKSSSAELSEAINSMFSWYRHATICFVHLSDVVEQSKRGFASSAWFTRGWTLQELLAPVEVEFYDHRWKELGTKTSLGSEISIVTGIPRQALVDFRHLDFNIAEKMSWASQRQTTRDEDRAYCLLGLFNVNMPMLYGEGNKAFQRLQEQIMQDSTDSSLFRWEGTANETFGMLASDPSCFPAATEQARRLSGFNTKPFPWRNGWSLNNAGMILRGKHLIFPYIQTATGEMIYVHAIDAHTLNGQAMFLQKDDSNEGDGSFFRVAVDERTYASMLDRSVSEDFKPSVYTDPLIMRQPLVSVLSSGQRGLTISVTSGDTVYNSARFGVRCDAYVRPDPLSLKSSTSWFIPTRHWNVKPADHPGARLEDGVAYSFFFPPSEQYRCRGIQCYFHVVIEGIETMICFGYDRDFRPIGLVIPFCDDLLSNDTVLPTAQRLSSLCGSNLNTGRPDPQLLLWHKYPEALVLALLFNHNPTVNDYLMTRKNAHSVTQWGLSITMERSSAIEGVIYHTRLEIRAREFLGSFGLAHKASKPKDQKSFAAAVSKLNKGVAKARQELFFDDVDRNYQRE